MLKVAGIAEEKSFSLGENGRAGRFELSQIPFSEYGWRVAAYSPNVNGDEELVVLTAEQPRREIHLGLRPPVSIHVRIAEPARQVVEEMVSEYIDAVERVSGLLADSE